MFGQNSEYEYYILLDPSVPLEYSYCRGSVQYCAIAAPLWLDIGHEYSKHVSPLNRIILKTSYEIRASFSAT